MTRNPPPYRATVRSLEPGVRRGRLATLLGSVQRRFRRARSGSVLILVVALLVLLALIGAAFITTTGSDRDAAVQHGYNTQVELLLQGVKDLVVAQLVEKVAPQSPPTAVGVKSFRPAPSPAAIDPALDPKVASLNFSNIDTPLWDGILAERFPEPIVASNTYPNEDEQAQYGIWNLISASPLGIRATDPLLYTNQWSSPYVGTDTGGKVVVPQASSRLRMLPTYIDYKDTSGTARKAPALAVGYTADVAAYNKYIMAADADGDGIADAGLFELPVGQINGVRYYAAIRVIDNSAAVNASIAMERMPTTPASDQVRLPVNAFPTNVDFRRMVEGPEYPTTPKPGTDSTADPLGKMPWDKLNWYRFGYSGTVTGPTIPELTPTRDDGLVPNFQFATRYDAFWTMLGSRPDNPGMNSTAGNRYRALGLAESIPLAARFCLPDPNGSYTTLENALPRGMRQIPAINRQPYRPDQAVEWFQKIFDYDYLGKQNPSEIPLRPLLVGYNPVTNYVPGYNNPVPVDEEVRRGRYQYMGDWATGLSYQVGDWVRSAVPANAYSPTRTVGAFVCVSNHVSSTAPVTAGTPSTFNRVQWAEVPWSANPVKINPNTASFGALYAAYSAVMFDGPRARPGGALPSATDFGGAFPSDEYWTFGNVLRPASGGAAQRFLDPNADPIVRRQNTGYMVRQLRAAIAAVNTIDLRDQDDDVTSRSVTLTPKAGGNIRTVQVYGTERQPVITEVCVDFDQMTAKQWVALELYNPSPVPLSLAAFRLVYRGRASGDETFVQIPLPATFAAATIPAYGRVYVESAAADVDRPLDIQTKPEAAVVRAELANSHKVAGLLDVLAGNRELFLMRTRSYAGTVTSNTDPANSYNEANLADLVPVDQMEFAGIVQRSVTHGAVVSEPVTTRYHYRRANAATGTFVNRWHSVFGGPYNPTPPAGERRQRGWISDRDPKPDPAVPDGPLEPSPVQIPGFGLDKARIAAVSGQSSPTDASYPSAESTYRTRTLQVANVGMAGPWSPLTNRRLAEGGFQNPPLPLFPAGGFLRTGDLLAVTYVGNYRIDGLATGGGFDEKLPELNSITMDAGFAEDGDLADDDTANGTGAGFPVEQLGRFAPLKHSTGAFPVDDLKDRPGFNPLSPPADVRYHWAIDLFDYFSVICPQDDWLANVDPDGYLTTGATPVKKSGDPTLAGVTPANSMIRKWPGETITASDSLPQAVPNGLAVTKADDANYGREDSVPVHGLININTAPPKVLALLPFTEDVARNRTIAQKIIQYRRTVGPIRNLFELNNIAEVAEAFGDLNTTAFNPTLTDGDVSPLDVSLTAPAGTSGETVGNDYEARYLVLNRISNMVSFRSDCFTAYVVVQGWRNAGTKAPELVAQRRAAMIIDRSSVRPMVGKAPGAVDVTAPTIINVPNN